eukprot:6485900-Amphidinium_carterae.1
MILDLENSNVLLLMGACMQSHSLFVPAHDGAIWLDFLELNRAAYGATRTAFPDLTPCRVAVSLVHSC